MANEEEADSQSPRNRHEDDEIKKIKGGKDKHDRGDEIDPATKLKRRQIEEILDLPAADHPGMVLVTAPLTGSNFLNWSRSIRRALAARSKLEFIDGIFIEPDATSEYYKRWLKVDYMVSTWITNSISKELVNAFNNIDSSLKLWNALNRRFGGCNGPKILKLQREISRFSQGGQNVTAYFNHLNSLWDEMDMLQPPLNCSCSAKSLYNKREDEMRLLTFLIGLNDSYEATRTQIMLIKPLPSLDNAYSMIIQVEDQRSLNESGTENKNLMSMSVGKQNFNTQNQAVPGGSKQPFQKPNNPPFKRRLSKEERKELRCSHCQATGHEMEECFKLHGIPECFANSHGFIRNGTLFLGPNRKCSG